MPDVPKFWDQIQAKMGVESFEGIEKYRDILNFLGYKTMQSVAKLQQQQKLDHCVIEAGKLHANVQFQTNFPNLATNFGSGDILVLKEIANAALICMRRYTTFQDEETIKMQIHERCKQIASNLSLSNILVDLNEKPKCEIVCPFEECSHVSKLSLMKQNDMFALPKFNRFNFERHFTGQHLIKKRKPFDDVSNLICEAPEKSKKTSEFNNAFIPTSTITHQLQQIFVAADTIVPNSSQFNLDDETLNQQKNIERLQNENAQLRQQQQHETSSSLIPSLENKVKAQKEKIDELEAENALLRQQQPLANQTSTHVLELEYEISAQKTKIQTLENRNEILHQKLIAQRNKYMDIRGTIRTVCRIKPENGQQCYRWNIKNDNTVLEFISSDEVSSEKFYLDYIFEPNHTNADIFDFIRPLVAGAVVGVSACIIAYGASGSGKSYTMYGCKTDIGIIPNAIKFLIDNNQNGEIYCSSFEIYNENVVDLLINGETENSVKIQNDCVVNLTRQIIQSKDQIDSILTKANSNRIIAATGRNQGSSRSHAVVQLTINGVRNDKSFESRLMLLDLAGAENLNDHLNGNDKTKRAAEMSNINKSVSALRMVIESLKKKSNHTEFRNSKLTQVLKPCLTSNFKTMFLATCSQDNKYLATSRETLSLVKSASKISING